MKKLKVVFLLLVGFAFFGFTEQIEEEHQTKLKVALMPFFGENDNGLSEAFFIGFQNAQYEIADSSLIRHAITNHQLFNQWVRGIPKLNSNSAISGYNTYRGLTDIEIIEIRADSQDVAFMVFPTPVTVKTILRANGSGNIFSNGSIKVVDMKTGKLISICTKKIKLKYKSVEPSQLKKVEKLVEKLIKCFE